MTSHPIDSIISLLSDNSRHVFKVCAETLISMGAEAVPALEMATESPDPVLAKRATRVLNRIRAGQNEKAFEDFLAACGEDVDLEEGSLLIASIVNPGCVRAHYSGLLDEMADQVARRLGPSREMDAVVRAMRSEMFGALGFSGSHEDYEDPSNCLMDRVIDSRTGIPITLSLVYLFLGRRIGVEFSGIALPGHFLVGLPGAAAKGPWVDPFHGGRTVDRGQIDQYLAERRIPALEVPLEPATPLQVLQRLLRNLHLAYERREDRGRAAMVGRWEQLAAGESPPPLPPTL